MHVCHVKPLGVTLAYAFSNGLVSVKDGPSSCRAPTSRSALRWRQTAGANAPVSCRVLFPFPRIAHLENTFLDILKPVMILVKHPARSGELEDPVHVPRAVHRDRGPARGVPDLKKHREWVSVSRTA